MTIQATPKTLILITHPEFAQGYQRGRDWFLTGEGDNNVDDKYLVECICIFAKKGYCKVEYRNEMYWHIGFLLGMCSGTIIPEEA